MVREIDALGGAMGSGCTDATAIQFRLLNRGKGPAMHSPRAQCDKKAYQFLAKLTVERQENLTLRQEMVEGFVVEEDRVSGVRCRGDVIFYPLWKAVVINDGHVPPGFDAHRLETKTKGGRAGDGRRWRGCPPAFAPSDLTSSVSRPARHTRVSTGGPSTLLSACTPKGDVGPLAVLFPLPIASSSRSSTMPYHRHERGRSRASHPSWNLHRAPMYSGQIESTGPRYCPSSEDKVVRFADRDRLLQIFLEPEGRNTLEYYCNGILDQPRARRAGGGCPFDRRSGTRGDHAVRLRRGI